MGKIFGQGRKVSAVMASECEESRIAHEGRGGEREREGEGEREREGEINPGRYHFRVFRSGYNRRGKICVPKKENDSTPKKAAKCTPN